MGIWGMPATALAQSPICVSEAMTMWEETSATTDCEQTERSGDSSAIPICGENAESTVAPPPIVYRQDGVISECADADADVDSDDAPPAQVEATWSDGLTAGWFSAAQWPYGGTADHLPRDQHASGPHSLDRHPDLRPPIARG